MLRGLSSGDARRQFQHATYDIQMSTPITVQYLDGSDIEFDTLAGTWVYGGFICFRSVLEPDEIVYLPASQVRTIRIGDQRSAEPAAGTL